MLFNHKKGNNEETIKLRTGVVVDLNFFNQIYNQLYELNSFEPNIFTFLVQKCRNQNFDIIGYTKQVLLNYQLLNEKDDVCTVPNSIRDIVLACSEGEGFKAHFCPPEKDPAVLLNPLLSKMTI